MYLRNNQAKAAELCLKQYLAQFSKNPSHTFVASVQLAHILLLSKQYKEAVDVINKALSIRPNSSAALLLKGNNQTIFSLHLFNFAFV